MSDLIIHIEQLTRSPANGRKTIFKNVIPINDDVSFPYERVMHTFRTILPNKELVFNFTII